MIQFESTRHRAPPVDFFEALLQGLAPDGGLYNPTALPNLQAYRRVAQQDFAVAARALAAAYDQRLAYSQDTYRSVIFPFAPHFQPLNRNIALLELFHGPTGAFKDFGASFLAYSMSRALQQQRRSVTILTATSGDTGSAVAHAFYRKEHINVVVLYPAGRVSTLQRQQICTFGENIHPLEVAGSFDDCQRLVKQSFQDDALRRQLLLTSANSINIGRLLPQQFYYHYAYQHARQQAAGRIFMVVPSGNLGNLTAALLAIRSDPQIAGAIVASNANRVFPQYLRSGRYRPHPSKTTYSNAMDVGRPSNFERLQMLFDNRLAAIRQVIPWAVAVSNRHTLLTIQQIYRHYGSIVDPHTATGLYAAQRFLASAQSRSDDYLVVLATAHPAKFGDVLYKALGLQEPLPARFETILHRQSQATPIAAHWPALRALLIGRFG